MRGCGVADAVRESGRELWGVVYEIDNLDRGKLDRCEGYTPGRECNSYWRRECLVLLDGDVQRPLTACSYFAAPQPNPPLPDSDYKDIIISGARHWRLPEDYVRDLEAIVVRGK